MLYSAELRRHSKAVRDCFFLFFHCALCLLDAGLLTGEVAEVEYACTANFTNFVELYLLDEGGLVGENLLDTNAACYLADCECLCVRGSSADLDNYTAEVLKSFLVTFLDTIRNCYGITSLELGISCSLVLREGLFY